MPTPGSFRPRQGLLRRQAASIPLPTIWIEMGDTGRPWSAYSEHPIWKLPNVYPFIRIDTRQDYGTDGAGAYRSYPGPPAAEVFATNVLNRFQAYTDVFGPIFRSVGKKLRYAILFLGPDAINTTVRLTTDPLDVGDPERQRRMGSVPGKALGRSRARSRRNGVPEGQARIGADAPGRAGGTAFFHVNGRRVLREWAVDAFATAAETLAGNDLPMPEIMLTDFESAGKAYYYGYPCSTPSGWGEPQPNGWFGRLRREYPLQPHLHSYLLEGDRTFDEWMADHSKTLDGSDIPPQDTTKFANHPDNDDSYQQMIAANIASFAKTMNEAVYEPAKAAFGSQLKCAEFAFVSNGRVYPTETRPGLLSYAMNGELGFDFQVAFNYFGFPFAHDLVLPRSDTDPRWDIQDNWTQRMQLAGLPLLDRTYRTFLEKYSAVAWGAARSSRLPLFPTNTVYYLVQSNGFEEFTSLVTESLARSVVAGARNFWMFEPSFNSSSEPPGEPDPEDIRAAVYEQVQSLNKRVMAMNGSRNRVPRAGHVSFPYLAVNK